MTVNPSDGRDGRCDDLPPNGEGGGPADRSDSGEKITEADPRISENNRPQEQNANEPGDINPPAEPQKTPPNGEQGEELSSSPSGEFRAEEDALADKIPWGEEKGDDADGNQTGGGKADDEEDDDDETDNSLPSPKALFRFLKRKPRGLFLPAGKKKIPFQLLILLRIGPLLRDLVGMCLSRLRPLAAVSPPLRVLMGVLMARFGLLRIDSVRTLRLNASLEELPDRFSLYAESLRAIKVPDENPHFRSIDGVLYSKDGKKLLFYPPNKEAWSFSVPEPVETIASFAFCRCEQLRRLRFPGTLRTLEEMAIAECPNLREIHLPSQVETVDNKAFYKTKSLERIEVHGTSVPAEESPAQERFRSIDGVLYSGDLKRLVLYPCGRDDAHFDIPDSVEVIGRGALVRCAFLRSIHLGPSVREIELLMAPIEAPCGGNASVFYGCELLKSFDVDPANPVFQSIDGVLYQNGARNLISYPLAKKDRTFRIPDSVEVIAPYAFAANKNIERVIFSDSVQTIEQGAFIVCENLRGVLLSDSLRSIGDRAFAGCDLLPAIRIPKSLRGFDRCFDSCPSLERVDVDPENPDFRGNCGVLFSKDFTHLIYCPAAWPRRSVVVPDQVTTIEAGAFEDCRKLRAVKVPATVRVIEDSAFRGPEISPHGSQTIYAKKGSAAWRYAKENHINVANIRNFPEEDLLD
ncbi:MAG: leucine-rich repeat protein [Thermoguttaceae bacterium]|nr:leucine-rich repeat protein [Thermoguttaceae bacterium]